MPSASIPDFVAHWKTAALTERAGSQSHFADLAHALGERAPAEADPAGTWYTFERGLTKSTGGQRWADVWRKGAFAWEYKGRHKDLGAACQQLLQYREALENSPLLIVSDMLSFEVHTNFTNTVKTTYRFTLDDLLANQPTTTCAVPPLTVLRAAFNSPDTLRPGQTTARVTEAAAEKFARLARRSARRGDSGAAAGAQPRPRRSCTRPKSIGIGEEFSTVLGPAGPLPGRAATG